MYWFPGEYKEMQHFGILLVLFILPYKAAPKEWSRSRCIWSSSQLLPVNQSWKMASKNLGFQGFLNLKPQKSKVGFFFIFE